MTGRPPIFLGIAVSILLAFPDGNARAATSSPHVARVPRWSPATPAAAAGPAPQEPACTPPTPIVTTTPACTSIKLTGSVPSTNCIPTAAVISRDGVYKATITSLPPTWTDTSPVPGTNHKYEVYLLNGSTRSGTRTVYSACLTPGQVSLPTVTAGCSSIVLTWSAPASPGGTPTGYSIYRNNVALTTTTNLSFTDSGVVQGQAYSYKVAALNGSCTGAFSATTSPAYVATPATPAKPAATAACRSVVVQWSAVSGAVTAYQVYRNGSYIGQVSAGTLTYTDTGVTASSTYAIRAINGSCSSSLSPSSNAAAPLPGGATPATPTAEGLCGKVRVSWNSVAEPVTAYVIYRNGQWLAEVPKTQNWYDDATASGPSSYTVAASNAGCVGSPSSASLAAEPSNPGQPGNVTATAGCPGVTVSWTVASGNVTGYQVYRNGQPLTSVAASPTQYLDATASGAVWYTVAAVNGGCEGAPSAASGTVTRPTTPDPPGVPTAVEGCGKIVITWSAATGDVTGYRLYRGESFLVQVSAATLTHDDTGAPPNSTYKVRAVNGECEGPFSGISASASPGVAPAAPGLQPPTPGCGYAEVRWSAPAPPFTGFRLYRNGAPLERVFGPEELTYRDEDVTTSAYYAVSALNGPCEGPLSSRSATIQIPTAPGAPGTPTATGGCGLVTVTWTAAPGPVTGYRVLRQGEFLEQVTGLNYPDRTAPPNSTYQVMAVNGECRGPVSGTSGAATSTAVPAAPTGFSATAGCGRVSLAWTAPAPPFTAFKLYRNNVVLVAALPDTARHYDDLTSTGNATYRIAAVNASCEGAASAPAAAAPAVAPAPPSGKPTVTPACGRLIVSWNASASAAATGYRVYRGADLVAGVAAGTRSYEDPDPPANSSYQVSAITGTCEGGKSPASDPRSPLASPGTPGTPVASGLCGGVRVAWERIPAFSGQYALYRNGSLLVSLPAADSLYTDTAAPTGASYQVSAQTGSCEGPRSATSNAASPLNPGPVGAPLVTVACDRLILTWSAAAGTVTGYRLYRNSAFLVDLPASPLRHEDVGAPANSTYKLAALNASCEGLSSSPTSPQSPLVLPVVAQAPAVSADCGRVSVSWSAATGPVDAYHVYRDDQRIAELASDVRNFEDVEASGASRYTVRAVRQSCEGEASPASDAVSPIALPVAPAAPVATAGCGYIDLDWQAPAGQVTHYRVLRNGATLATVGAEARRYRDLDPPPDASYAVLALNGTCAGPPSPASTTVTPTVRPEAPGAPRLEASCGQVTIQWQPVAGATRYVILRDGARLDSLPASAPLVYVDAAPGTGERDYAVAARNDCGEGLSPSAAATAPAPPAPPANLRAEAGCGSILLTWEARAGSTKYRIYRDGALLDSVAAGVTYQDVRPGTAERRYEVSAVGSCGESARSAPYAVTAGLVPAAPGAPTLSTGCGSIEVRWSAVAGALSYAVRRDGQLLADGVTGIAYTDAAPGSARRCYTVQAAAGSCAGAESEGACATAAPCARDVTINTSGSDQAADYRMVAFPVAASDATIAATLQDDLGEPDALQWRFGCWVATRDGESGPGGYVEPGQGLTHIRPGLGYWILTRNAARLRVRGLPVGEDPFEIPLTGPANSWHQVGNPYLARVPVSSIRVRVEGSPPEPLLTQAGNLTDRAFQGWHQGQYAPVTTFLDSLTGYWIRKLDARTVTLLVPAPAASEAPAPPGAEWPAPADWAIAVEARQGAALSGRIMLGAADLPADRWNPQCLASPPAPLGGAPGLAVRVSDWGALNGAYQQVLGPDAERMDWTLQFVGLRVGRPLTLNILPHDLPADRRVVRCDALGRVVEAWSPPAPLVLLATGESMTVRLAVLAGEAAPAPGEATLPLLAAAPNPFRGAIEFTLRLDVPGPLRLDVFDARGRLVRRLASAETGGPVRTAWWDGRDASGRLAPGGVYFVRPPAGPDGERPLLRLVKLP